MYSIAAVETCADTSYTIIINFLISLFSHVSKSIKRRKGQSRQRKDDLHSIALNSENYLILADTFFTIFTNFSSNCNFMNLKLRNLVSQRSKLQNIQHFNNKINHVLFKFHKRFHLHETPILLPFYFLHVRSAVFNFVLSYNFKGKRRRRREYLQVLKRKSGKQEGENKDRARREPFSECEGK